jgi:hypothetical protein
MGKKYRALVRHGYEIFHLGTFDTPEQASEFAERLAKKAARQVLQTGDKAKYDKQALGGEEQTDNVSDPKVK